MRIPASSLVGEEERLCYILSGMNAERILIAAECIGDAKWFIESAARIQPSASLTGQFIKTRNPVSNRQSL